MERYKNKIKIFFMFLIVTLSLSFVMCDKANPQSSNPSIDVNGSWSGKTNQNEDISFTVDSSIVKYFKIKVISPGSTIETKITGSICEVSNEVFDFSSLVQSYPQTIRLTVTGEFTSVTSAEGTFKMGTTTGTWTVTKE